MAIVGLKPPRPQMESAPEKKHILFRVFEAWQDDRFKKYKGKSTLERWTIDRHDTESSVVRIERVSALKPLEEFVKELADPDSVPQDVDCLAWWDADSVRNEHLDTAKLVDILDLAELAGDGNSADYIVENTVYLVLVHTEEDKDGKLIETIVKSFPGTSYARNLAKKMYGDLIGGGVQKGGAA